MNSFWLILVVFFGFQAVIIGSIVFFLRRKLFSGLQEETVHQFEVLYAHELPSGLTEIEVVSCGDLPQTLRDRIAQSAAKKFGRPIEIKALKDPFIRGGLIIRAGAKVIDGSLRTKLKEGGMLRGQGKGQA